MTDIKLKDLPRAALLRWLEQNLRPGGDQFLLPNSVGEPALADGAVTTLKLATLNYITFEAIDDSDVPDNSVFRDVADDKLKFKDDASVINDLY